MANDIRTAAPETATLVAPFRTHREAWSGGEPDVLILRLDEYAVRGHAAYQDAKAGDRAAARRLVAGFLDRGTVRQLAIHHERGPVLLPVTAQEAKGVNAIPLALSQAIGSVPRWPIQTHIVQCNAVGRTRRDGYYRLAMQPVFHGMPVAGRHYILVDDFIGQGATLANLRGHVLAHGAMVCAIASLTGKPHSARLALPPSTLAALRALHGSELEHWWRQVFGFGFGQLTESEARYLGARADADRIRDQVAARIRAAYDRMA